MSISLVSRIDVPGAPSVQLRRKDAGKSVMRVVCATIALALATPMVANAGDVPDVGHAMKIPPQPLGTALQELAKQSGIQIIFFSELTEGHDAPALNGHFTPESALRILLRGTDLTFLQLNEKTIQVVPGARFHKTVNESAASLPPPGSLPFSDTGNAPTIGEPTWPLRLAQAQTQEALRVSAEAPVPEQAHGTIEEVIVTARKVRENQQDTPVAITAFSGDALAQRQVFATDKLTQVVPNLQFGTNAPLAGNNSSSQVFIRGIGQTDPTSTVDPGVGLYIDDVYIGSAVGSRMDLRDISSVQVLRGPQGTLFGRNTIGGAILVSTSDPGNQFGGTARGGFGSDHLYDGSLALDVPITDTLKSRFTAARRKQDGYVTRTDGTDLGDTNTYTLTSKFLWKPTDRLEARWLAEYSSADEHGSPLVFAAINTAATFPRVASAAAGCPGFNGKFTTLPAVPNIPDDRCANNFQYRGPFHNNGTAPLKSTLEAWGSSINLVYKLTDEFSLKSISAYRNVRWTGARDADNTPLTILNTFYNVHSWQWSQELQGIYHHEALTGVLGAYYFKQRSDDIAPVQLNPPPGITLDSNNNLVDNKSWAAFTQWTYALLERLGLTAGARYSRDYKGSYPDQYDFAAPNSKFVPLQWYRDTFSAFTPSASVNYRWNKQAMTYVSYAQGFKGGGWNSHFNAVLTPAQQAGLQEFRPEKAKSYELGAKLDLIGNTLRLNTAVFDSDYTDMQITYRGPAPSGVAPFLTNAGKARIKGAEAEMTWAPTLDWSIEASIGHLESSIDRLDITPLAVIPPGLKAGNQLPFAPRWQGHLGVAYTAHAYGLRGTPRVDASYQSQTFFDATNTREIAQLGGYTVLNASLAIAPEVGPWRLVLGVNNAADKIYAIAGNSSLSTGSGYAEIAYARPREYFGTFTYSF
jgi:iron complex outermembrane receptor protein